jgi:hypothetical protein
LNTTTIAPAVERKSQTGGRALPIITLLALTTVIPELFTGSTPLTGFLNPGLLLFLFLGYGVAVLLLREMAVRCHCGVRGLFFLGLAYSVFNEGLLAKTLIVQKNLPVPLYDHYGSLLGISFPWAACIGAWHACASVLFPILLTHHFFPEARDKPWLNGKLALVLGLILMFLACAVFLGKSEKGVTGTPAQLVVLLATMLLGFLFGDLSKGEVPHGPASSAVKPILLGLSILVPFWGLGFLASAKVPLALFFVAWLAVILLYAGILKHRRWLTLPSFLFFGVGWYLHNAVQAAVVVAIPGGNPLRALITAMIHGLILWLLLRQIRRTELLHETQLNPIRWQVAVSGYGKITRMKGMSPLDRQTGLAQTIFRGPIRLYFPGRLPWTKTFVSASAPVRGRPLRSAQSGLLSSES